MVDGTALTVVLLQGAIFGLFLVAVRRRDTAAATNALGSFVLALLPVVVELAAPAMLARSVSFGPVLGLWLSTAGFLHSLGMLGLYESTWWWDHLTHTLSAALVAALLYAALIVAFSKTAGLADSRGTIAALTVTCTFVVGVFWELLELVARDVGERLDVEPVLVHYGWRDTVADLGFDVVGAVVVLGIDLRVLVPVVEQFPGVVEAILVGSGLLIVGGSVLMAVFVSLGESMQP